MRIRKISDNEVTVYLNTEELEDFEFSMEDGVPREESLHNFLFNVMELVQNETDFDPYNGGRLVVEAIHSPNGMKLLISRLERRRLTREEFSRVKRIKVRKPDPEFEGLKAYAELLGLLGALEHIAGRDERKSFTFVFDSFTALEDALVNIEDKDLGGCAIYRSGARYAFVVKAKRSDRIYNVLSEFADICHGGSVLAADIGEGWRELAKDAKLTELAQAVRNMK